MTTEIVILVVDDNHSNRQLLGEMLEMKGYGVRLAPDGLEGLELARSVLPSLILLDENMPGMDGVEVCRNLKLDPALKKIPVIFLSGLDSTSLKIQAFREGAVDFITKPFHAEEVLARVHTHLQLVQQVELEAKSKELQESHDAQKLLLEQYTALFDYAPVGYVLLDRIGRILNINLAGANMFGQVRSRIRKLLLVQFVIDEDQQLFVDFLKKVFSRCARKSTCELRLIKGDGAPFFVQMEALANGSGLECLVTITDVTTLKNVEKSLQESEQSFRQLNRSLEESVTRAIDEVRQKDQILILHERRAVMGEMINNIAHQWRQPLNVLGLNLQELPYAYGTPGFNREYLENCVDSSMLLIGHMSQTIDDFRNFFSSDKEISEFSVNKVIERTLALVDKNFQRQKVSIEFQKETEPLAKGYPNEYSQALLNILINARDALIDCRSSDAQILIRSFTEGEKAVVTVADNAGGIADDIIDRLFAPYFTTKGPEKGTGIGLFMSMTIIEKNMGGRLTVRNTGNGAEFRIEV